MPLQSKNLQFKIVISYFRLQPSDVLPERLNDTVSGERFTPIFGYQIQLQNGFFASFSEYQTDHVVPKQKKEIRGHPARLPLSRHSLATLRFREILCERQVRR